jgi:hypothetical protein
MSARLRCFIAAQNVVKMWMYADVVITSVYPPVNGVLLSSVSPLYVGLCVNSVSPLFVDMLLCSAEPLFNVCVIILLGCLNLPWLLA